MIKRFAMTAAALAVVGAFNMPAAQAQTPMLGEIKWVGFNFAPRGYAKCDGQLLSVAQNSALFSLLGTQYGGDGRTTFALPDARGRSLVHTGSGPGLTTIPQGSRGGSEVVTLSAMNLPAHAHDLNATATLHATDAPGAENVPTGRLLADDGRDRIYAGGTANVTMSSQAVTVSGDTTAVGGGQPFSIRSPYVAANCIVALVGVYPSRN